MPAIIITSATCRECRRGIPASVAFLFGKPDGTYIHPDCLEIEKQQLAAWRETLKEFQTKEVDIPGDPVPCAMCDSTGNDEMVLVPIDGVQALICLRCEPKYYETHPEQLALQLQLARKLR